jgi:fibronectin type 3 domain-containing protein
VGKDVTVGARAVSRKGRAGAWSNLVRLRVVQPLEAPQVSADSAPAGVRLTWNTVRPGATYRVFRREQSGQDFHVVADRVESADYVDPAAAFGKTYEYSVQAALPAGDADALSGRSEPVIITPVDRFPPAVPAGLHAVPSVGSIELSWNPNPEPDLAGYYVYRSVDGGPFHRVEELLRTPSYRDNAVDPGKRSRYAVSSVDQSGNESMRSQPVEAVAPT